MTLTLVTGNPGKLREYVALLPQSSDITFETYRLNLPEIQSLDLQAIVEDKLKRAYEILSRPVIVEDVSTGVDRKGGLPGPFFKFYEEVRGSRALLEEAGRVGEPVTITCTSGYYDGETLLFGSGVIHGTVCEPRGKNGFGFDPVVIPDGETRTFAEMSTEEKNAISHRSLAVTDLLKQIERII